MGDETTRIIGVTEKQESLFSKENEQFLFSSEITDISRTGESRVKDKTWSGSSTSLFITPGPDKKLQWFQFWQISLSFDVLIPLVC